MDEGLKHYFQYVFPAKDLSSWERIVLLSAYVAADGSFGKPFVATLPTIARLAGASESTARQSLRTLAAKQVLTFELTSKGFQITLPLPQSIVEVTPTPEPSLPDIDELDFYEGRKFVAALLARQDGTCFYSLKTLDERTCELDHLVPQASGGDNSHRNIVCCSFEMNKRKGDSSADDFLRQLYRTSGITFAELEERLNMLAEIQKGELPPALAFSAPV